MIVFITSQDSATQDNLAVAGHLAQTAIAEFCGHDAVRGNILAALVQNPGVPLLALSHGSKEYIEGHDDEPALTTGDFDLLTERESYALACHTAAVMGPAIAAEGGTWFGFAGPVSCLPADADVIQHFQSVLDFVVWRLPGCNNVAAAQSFIADIDALAERLYPLLDQSNNPMESLYALRCLIMRLRIWVPHHHEAIRHPEALDDHLL